MIALLVRHLYPRRVELAGPEITIGSGAGCTIASADTELAPLHCKLLVRAAGVFVVDTSGGKTTVNGRPFTGPRPLYTEDKIDAGELDIIVDQVDLPIDEHEQDLLRAITRGDDESREIYADWLEENGDARRAEFLRIEELIVKGIADAATVRRHAWLVMVVPYEWRVVASRPLVANCERDCRRTWCQLEPTEHADERRCPECQLVGQFEDTCVSIPPRWRYPTT